MRSEAGCSCRDAGSGCRSRSWPVGVAAFCDVCAQGARCTNHQSNLLATNGEECVQIASSCGDEAVRPGETNGDAGIAMPTDSRTRIALDRASAACRRFVDGEPTHRVGVRLLCAVASRRISRRRARPSRGCRRRRSPASRPLLRAAAARLCRPRRCRGRRMRTRCGGHLAAWTRAVVRRGP